MTAKNTGKPRKPAESRKPAKTEAGTGRTPQTAGWLHSIGARILFPTIFVFVLLSLVLITLTDVQMRRNAVSDAEERASLLLDHNLAIHTYFTHQLKPAVFILSDSLGSDPAFDPAWMSSTFAVREIMGYLQALGDSTYYYKEAAIDARNPANEADEFERRFIQELNRDPDLMVDSRVRVLGGQPQLAVMRRGEVMEEACLRCHSTPDRAPQELVEAYGPERSFGREPGEVVSAISIHIPLSVLYARARQVTARMSGFLTAILLAVFGLHTLLTHRLAVKPIRDLSTRIRSLAGGPHHLGEQVPLPPSRELGELSLAFNEMSLGLKSAMDELESRVEARTQDRLEALKELRLSQATLQVAMDQSTAGIAIADAPDGRLRYVNDAGLGIRGSSREKVVNGIGVDQYVESWQILHFDGTPYRKDEVPLARAVMYGETSSAEFIIRRSHGEDRVVLANAAPILDPQGDIEAGIVVFVDITERKLAEEEVKDSRDRLRDLTTRLDEVREDERTILARELHDDVGQNLTAMRMELSMIEKEIPAGWERVSASLHSMIAITQDSVDRVNRLSKELRSPILDMLGLADAVESELWDFEKRWGTETSLEMEIGELETFPERDLAIFKILKESLSNVSRHAQAGRVEVSLRLVGEELVLEVVDNGIGITVDQTQGSRSFGLIGMRERAGRLGGEFEVQRREEGGTRVRVSVPISPENG